MILQLELLLGLILCTEENSGEKTSYDYYVIHFSIQGEMSAEMSPEEVS